MGSGNINSQAARSGYLRRGPGMLAGMDKGLVTGQHKARLQGTGKGEKFTDAGA